MNIFDRSQHVYISPSFDEIIKETIRFFDATPVHSLPIAERFQGTGVYALYCIAQSGIYSRLNALNQTAFRLPIYVGKAVPKGWRQARQFSPVQGKSYELSNRLREHSRNLNYGEGLEISDFFCRFIILENKATALIGTIEAALIQKYKPIWNTLIDGFGNHDPGKGRYQQAKSDWDVCHPGRAWAQKCRGVPADREELYRKIEDFLNDLDEEEI